MMILCCRDAGRDGSGGAVADGRRVRRRGRAADHAAREHAVRGRARRLAAARRLAQVPARAARPAHRAHRAHRPRPALTHHYYYLYIYNNNNKYDKYQQFYYVNPVT